MEDLDFNLAFIFLSYANLLLIWQIRSLDMLRTRFTYLPEAFTKRMQPHQTHEPQLVFYTSREIEPWAVLSYCQPRNISNSTECFWLEFYTLQDDEGVHKYSQREGWCQTLRPHLEWSDHILTWRRSYQQQVRWWYNVLTIGNGMALVESFSIFSYHPGTGAPITWVPSLPGEISLFTWAATHLMKISSFVMALQREGVVSNAWQYLDKLDNVFTTSLTCPVASVFVSQ